MTHCKRGVHLDLSIHGIIHSGTKIMSSEISLVFTCSENSSSCSLTSARLLFNVSLNIEIKKNIYIYGCGVR